MLPRHTTEVDLPPYFEGEERPRMPTLEEIDKDLLRRFESEVVERRKRLTRVAAMVVGVAWMLCQLACARSVIGSIGDALDTPEPPAKVSAHPAK